MSMTISATKLCYKYKYNKLKS